MTKLKTLVSASLVVISVGYLSVADADNNVPVVNGYTPQMQQGMQQAPTAVPVSGDVSQQIADLRQQIAAQTQMLQQVQALQQQVQQLQGQLEDQTHSFQQLQQQQKQQYQDLDSRITQLSQAKGTVPAVMPAIAPVAAPTSLPAPGSAATTTMPVIAATPTPVAVTSNTAAGVTGAVNQSDEQMYQAAYNLMLNKQYPQATQSMQAYLAQYPQGTYAPNANYWLGELNLLQGNVDAATQSFNTVVTQFPKSPKVPDAMLKLGFAYYDQGNLAQAKTELTQVQQQFPNSSAARLAAQKLKTMQAQ